jgi:hypothetical protein
MHKRAPTPGRYAKTQLQCPACTSVCKPRCWQQQQQHQDMCNVSTQNRQHSSSLQQHKLCAMLTAENCCTSVAMCHTQLAATSEHQLCVKTSDVVKLTVAPSIVSTSSIDHTIDQLCSPAFQQQSARTQLPPRTRNTPMYRECNTRSPLTSILRTAQNMPYNPCVPNKHSQHQPRSGKLLEGLSYITLHT